MLLARSVLFGLLLITASAVGAEDPAVDYVKQVKPILVARCAGHGRARVAGRLATSW